MSIVTDVYFDAHEIHSESETLLVGFEEFLQENFPENYPTTTLHNGGWMGFSISINDLSGSQRDALYSHAESHPHVIVVKG